MPEPEKIKNIMKGIDEDTFQRLLAKNLSSIAELIKLFQSYDELRKWQALTRCQVTNDKSLVALAVNSDQSTLLLQIKVFIHE